MKTPFKVYDYKKWSQRILVYQMDTTQHFIQARLDSLHIRNITINYTEASDDLSMGDFSGVIVSGSRTQDSMPDLPHSIIKSKIPKLGICFGHEILALEMGAQIEPCNDAVGEKTHTKLTISKSPLFEGLDPNENYIVDMNHLYEVKSLPAGFTTICSTDLTEIAGYQNLSKKIFGVQFHPERSTIGDIIFQNFHQICLDAIP